MIRTVKVTNYRGETLTMELSNPYSSGLAVTKITGLGPEKATINTVEIASNDGALYNSGRVESRNIVITLLFVGEDVEEIRRKTYRYFPLNKPLSFEVITDKRAGAITGYVESNEPNIFSQTESTQISIICPNPYFHSTSGESNSVVFFGEEALFEFPFSNEGDDNQIELGAIHRVTEENVYYPGDIETGAVFTIHALGEAKNIRIYNLDTRDYMLIKTELVKGDDIIISTVTGNKYIKRLRDGVYTNLINSLDRNSDWLTLSKGDNAIAYVADSGLDTLQFEVSFDILYEGV